VILQDKHDKQLFRTLMTSQRESMGQEGRQGVGEDAVERTAKKGAGDKVVPTGYWQSPPCCRSLIYWEQVAPAEPERY